MRFLIALFLSLAAGPVLAAQCVEAILLDANKNMVAQVPPYIGFMMPGVGPVVNQQLEPGMSVLAGQATECPADLLAAMQKVFDDSCLTDGGRSTAATSNVLKSEKVNERCKDLYKALHEK